MGPTFRSKGGVKMSCPNSNSECKQTTQCNNQSSCGGYGYNGYVCIIVLYILLAIILGAFVR